MIFYEKCLVGNNTEVHLYHSENLMEGNELLLENRAKKIVKVCEKGSKWGGYKTKKFVSLENIPTIQKIQEKKFVSTVCIHLKPLIYLTLSIRRYKRYKNIVTKIKSDI